MVMIGCHDPGVRSAGLNWFEFGVNYDLIILKTDPGYNDKHAARDVDGDEVVGELTLEHQVHRQAAVLS